MKRITKRNRAARKHKRLREEISTLKQHLAALMSAAKAVRYAFEFDAAWQKQENAMTHLRCELLRIEKGIEAKS